MLQRNTTSNHYVCSQNQHPVINPTYELLAMFLVARLVISWNKKKWLGVGKAQQTYLVTKILVKLLLILLNKRSNDTNLSYSTSQRIDKSDNTKIYVKSHILVHKRSISPILIFQLQIISNLTKVSVKHSKTMFVLGHT